MLKRIFAILFIFSSYLANINIYAVNVVESKKLNDWEELSYDESPCGGKYIVPEFEKMTENQISADSFSYSQKAMSVLTGNVVFREQDRELNSDKVFIYRDPKTSKFKIIKFYGNVKLQQKDVGVISSEAEYDVEKEDLVAKNSEYHIYEQHARGTAKKITAHKKEIYTITDGSYTTCGPHDNAWRIKSRQLEIDYPNNRGTAKSAVFLIKNTPVLYLPYYSFQLEKRRTSGFLAPGIHNSSDDGWMVGIPYYFNLAPNYDDTFIPEYIQKRGPRITNEFRYLTENSRGEITAQVLPYDKKFGDIRWAIKSKNNAKLNKNFDFAVNYNRDSDDKFAEDFKEGSYAIGNINKLLQQATLSYHNPHWQNNITVKNYQILRPSDLYVEEPYKLLPQLNTHAFYPKVWDKLDFSLTSQFSYFYKDEKYAKPTDYKSSLREVIAPKFTYNFVNDSGFFKPSLEIKQVNYQLLDLNNPQDKAPAITHPIFNIDTGLVFERDFNFKNNLYTQTLEPRLFYIYVPYQNQSDLPRFDSGYAGFSYAQLFRTNLFGGFDRQSNQNGVSYALASNFFDIEGHNKLTAEIGQSYLFDANRVDLKDPDNPFAGNSHFSPLTSHLNFVPTDHLTLGIEELITPEPWTNYKTTVYFNYRKPSYNKQRLIEIGYSFLHNGDVQYTPSGTRLCDGVNNCSDDLHEIKLATQFPLNINWNLLGFALYNLKNNYIVDSLAGIEYESCCFAVRTGVRHYLLVRSNVDSKREYNRSIFIEFALKGLTSYGYGGDIGNFIKSRGVHNYDDEFGKKF